MDVNGSWWSGVCNTLHPPFSSHSFQPRRLKFGLLVKCVCECKNVWMHVRTRLKLSWLIAQKLFEIYAFPIPQCQTSIWNVFEKVAFQWLKAGWVWRKCQNIHKKDADQTFHLCVKTALTRPGLFFSHPVCWQEVFPKMFQADSMSCWRFVLVICICCVLISALFTSL